jgi:hypothetical protein
MKVSDWLGGASIVGLVVLIIYLVYWSYQHPCLQYEARYRQPWVEVQSHSCGKNCTMPVVVNHPGHWDQLCVVYGDRRHGDVEAPDAPIPAERNW